MNTKDIKGQLNKNRIKGDQLIQSQKLSNVKTNNNKTLQIQ